MQFTIEDKYAVLPFEGTPYFNTSTLGIAAVRGARSAPATLRSRVRGSALCPFSCSPRVPLRLQMQFGLADGTDRATTLRTGAPMVSTCVHRTLAGNAAQCRRPTLP